MSNAVSAAPFPGYPLNDVDRKAWIIHVWPRMCHLIVFDNMTVSNTNLANSDIVVLNNSTDSTRRKLVVPNFCDIPMEVFYSHVLDILTNLYQRGWRTVTEEQHMPYFFTLTPHQTLTSQSEATQDFTKRCPVCLEQWDTIRDPPLLLCTEGHCVCHSCLSSIVSSNNNNNMECVICRTPVFERGSSNLCPQERFVNIRLIN